MHDEGCACRAAGGVAAGAAARPSAGAKHTHAARLARVVGASCKSCRKGIQTGKGGRAPHASPRAHQGILLLTWWGTCTLMSWHRNSTQRGYSQSTVPDSCACGVERGGNGTNDRSAAAGRARAGSSSFARPGQRPQARRQRRHRVASGGAGVCPRLRAPPEPPLAAHLRRVPLVRGLEGDVGRRVVHDGEGGHPEVVAQPRHQPGRVSRAGSGGGRHGWRLGGRGSDRVCVALRPQDNRLAARL